MWRVAVLVGLLCFGAHVVLADEAGVLNDPPASTALLKEVINKLSPSYETVWDVYNGGFSQGVSGALYTFESRAIPLASARVGVATGERLYAGVSLDLPGISRRYLPQKARALAAVSPLDTVWSVVGKYARVGVVGGYSWDEDDPVIGLTAGAAVSF